MPEGMSRETLTLIGELLEVQRKMLLKCVRDSGGCDACEDGEDLWFMEDDPVELFHGYGDDVGECENMVLHEIRRSGLPIDAMEAKRCPEGHDWYGEDCPECQGEENPYL